MRQPDHPALTDVPLTSVLDALADPVRLSIVAALASGEERGWGEFDCGVANSTLSHHMKTLREAGVIRHRKDGTRCFVSLRADLEKRFPGLLKLILRLAERERDPG